mgnify:CR=1 FL=1
MKVSKEKIGPGEYVLHIEVEPERLQEPLRQAARRLNTRRPLSGFRPGKAPYHLVERIYGKELIFDEMLEQIGNELYQEALQQSQLDPYDRASFEIVQLEPLTLKVTLPVQPQVTLGDYHEIRVDPKPVSIEEAEIQEVLTQIQDSNAIWVPVEHAVQMGNQVLLDALGKAEDGSTVEQKDLTVEVSEEMTPRGFGQNLEGLKPGESKEFDVEYPVDFRDKDVAGKRVHFQVTMKAVREKELPALNDELAQSVGSYETLDQLRAEIQEKLRERKKVEAKDAALDEALDTLVKQATLEYPAVAVEREIDALIETFTDRLKQQGFTLDGYLNMVKKTPAQLRDETRPQAEERLKRALVLAKFAEAESIKVDKEEIDREVDRLSLSFGERAQAIKATLGTGQPLRSIASDVYRRKALEHLLTMVTPSAVSRDDQAELSEQPGQAETAPQDTESKAEESTKSNT